MSKAFMREAYVFEKKNCQMTKTVIKNISNIKGAFPFDEILKA